MPNIFNIRVISHGSPPNRHRRLAWDWDVLGNPPSNLNSVPWSPTTGPFSYFRVSLDGRILGDIGATQFVLRDEDISGSRRGEELIDANIKVTIQGFLFCGGSIMRWEEIRAQIMLREREDWVHI